MSTQKDGIQRMLAYIQGIVDGVGNQKFDMTKEGQGGTYTNYGFLSRFGNMITLEEVISNIEPNDEEMPLLGMEMGRKRH